MEQDVKKVMNGLKVDPSAQLTQQEKAAGPGLISFLLAEVRSGKFRACMDAKEDVVLHCQCTDRNGFRLEKGDLVKFNCQYGIFHHMKITEYGDTVAICRWETEPGNRGLCGWNNHLNTSGIGRTAITFVCRLPKDWEKTF